MIKQLQFYSSIVLLILFCIQAGRQSADIQEKPRINFKGQIMRANNKVYEVENITISGLYQQIPVYAVPEDQDTDPAEDTTFLDLAEIAQIFPTKMNPREGIHTFKNKEYIEITVVWKDSKKTTDNFIIELTRKILCDTLSEAGQISRQLEFTGLKKLKITGYTYRDIEQEKTKKQSRINESEKGKKTAAQKALCGQTSALLDDLKSESDKVKPLQTKEKITEITANLKDNIDALCT
ncbi:MAG: hypothetical protein WA432_00445 [Candidatus Babeliaceae bacterium]